MAGELKPVSGGMFQRMINRVVSQFHKSHNSFALEAMNPLWNISTREAQFIFDMARSGNYAKLQFIYHEIERTEPTLMVCVTRRAAALSELDWKVVRSDQRRNRNIDEKLVDEQISCLETEIARIENLPEAIEHLALAAFRGFAHVTPIHGADGSLKELQLLDNWNFCWDREERAWLWNPTASSFMGPKAGVNGLQKIGKGEIVSVVDPRPIDWPGLKIFLRSSVSERDWGRFLETYGLPPVIITMPDLTSEGDVEKFQAAAQSVFEGRSGVVPYGSEVNYASESRGVDPFSAYIEHQQKLIVLMATGGVLTSLAESGSGTLAGNAHEDTWLQIVRRDVRKLSNAINKQLCEQIIKEKFPNQPVLAEFKLETERDPSPKEVFEIAGAASNAGYQIDVKEICEQSGYTCTLKDQGGGMPPMGGDEGNEGEEGAEGSDGTEGAEGNNGEEAAKTLQEASKRQAELSKPLGERSEGAASTGAVTNAEKKATSAAQRLAWSLQNDFQEVAERIKTIIELPEAERAGACQDLIKDLDKLVPDDPSMASVIAEEMMKVFSKTSK